MDENILVEKVPNTKANTAAHQMAGLAPTSMWASFPEDTPSLEPALNQEKQADKGYWEEGENLAILRSAYPHASKALEKRDTELPWRPSVPTASDSVLPCGYQMAFSSRKPKSEKGKQGTPFSMVRRRKSS